MKTYSMKKYLNADEAQRNHTSSTKKQLKSFVLKSSEVLQLRQEMWQIYNKYYEVDRTAFFNRFTSNDFYAIYKDGEDIIGFTALRIRPITTQDGTFMTFYLGQSVIEQEFRGGSLIPKTCFNLFVQHFMNHPFMPLYVWCDALTYKPYMIFANAMERFYPSRQHTMTPKIRRLINKIGQTYYPDSFDPQTGTVMKGSNVIDDITAVIDEQKMQHPDIHFFTQANPKYTKGHGLITIAPINFRNFVSLIRKIANKKMSSK